MGTYPVTVTEVRGQLMATETGSGAHLSLLLDPDFEDSGVGSLAQDPLLQTVLSTDQDLLPLSHKQLQEITEQGQWLQREGEREEEREGERERGREGGREEEREIGRGRQTERGREGERGRDRVGSHVAEEDLAVGGAGHVVLAASRHHAVVIAEGIVVWVQDSSLVVFWFQVPATAGVPAQLTWNRDRSHRRRSNQGLPPQLSQVSPWRP